MKKLKYFFIVVCVIQLFYIFHYRSGFEYEIIKSPFSKNSGITQSLPIEVIETESILKKYNLTNFNLSENFRKNTYLYQRAVEFNYPVIIQASSKHVFFLKGEDLPSTCSILEEGSYIKLTHC